MASVEATETRPVGLERLVSFGYKYGEAVTVHDPGGRLGVVVIDARPLFPRNPHRLKRLRPLSGKDHAVQADVSGQPGFSVAWETLKARVAKAVIVDGAGTVAIGCTGGRHRSVYLVERLGREWGVAIEHRDLGK